VLEEVEKPLIFLRADLEQGPRNQPFVVIVRSREELKRWLHDGSSALQWLQVEDLSSDPEACALAAQGTGDIPLDVVLSSPSSEFAGLYRLVDVLAVRDVRVSIPARPGFLKAVRLAASLGLPVRLLPGQPSTETLQELAEALAFYLHDPRVEAPIEFFSFCAGLDAALANRLIVDDLRRRPGDFSPLRLQRSARITPKHPAVGGRNFIVRLCEKSPCETN
jgi:hypothetical protein